ncbi:hypothetical protein ACFX1Z_030307 [Malus domestica]
MNPIQRTLGGGTSHGAEHFLEETRHRKSKPQHKIIGVELDGSPSPITWLTATTILNTLHTHSRRNGVPICLEEVFKQAIRANFEVSSDVVKVKHSNYTLLLSNCSINASRDRSKPGIRRAC